MATWNSLYESTPREGYNPGYGARHFQGLKSRISERANIEHIWGDDETDYSLTGGYHREGSARVQVEDYYSDYTTSGEYYRGDTRIDGESLDDSQAIGRVIVTLTERDEALRVNNTLQTDESTEGDRPAEYKQSIAVICHPQDQDIETDTIFDYDAFVNTSFDQLASGRGDNTVARGISGDKEFLNQVVIIDIPDTGSLTKDTVSATTYSNPDSGLETNDYTLNMPVPVNQIRDLIIDAKEHNIFETTASESYNDDTSTADDGTVYNNLNIYADYIYGNQIVGAVWG